MENLDARVEEAAHLVQAERYEDVAKLLEEVRAANPDHYSALLLLGQIYGYFLNKLNRARVRLARVIKQAPQMCQYSNRREEPGSRPLLPGCLHGLENWTE